MRNNIKVAMIQYQCSKDKNSNIKKAINSIRKASSNNAKIICLQELFNSEYFCYEINEKYFEYAEPIPGPSINKISKVAKELKVVVIAPIFEKEMGDVFYNTAPVIGTNGEIIGKYRKMSIPLTTTELFESYEKYYMKPGNLGFPVFSTFFGINIGILICYDRHFPEAARILALKGADIIFIPTTTAGKTQYLWEIELKAHAVSNCCYIGGLNRVGADIGGRGRAFGHNYYGSSLFIDPMGNIISQAGDKKDEIIYAEIDTSISAHLKNEWGFFRYRRPDAYGPLCE